MNKISKFILPVLTAIVTFGCAPAAQDLEHTTAKAVESNLGSPPELIDEKNIRQNNFEILIPAEFSMAESAALIHGIGLIAPNESHELAQKLLALTPKKLVPIKDSPYTDLMATEGAKAAAKNLEGAIPSIDMSKNLILNWLRQNPIEPLPEDSSAEKSFEHMFAYFQKFESEIKNMNLMPVVEEALRDEIRKKIAHIQETVRASLNKGLHAQTLTDLIAATLSGLTAENLVLDKESLDSLNKGKTLGALLDQMSTPQDSLTVIVEIWKMLEPSERIENFKTKNKRLYEYLNSMNSEELKCLAAPNCLVPTKFLAKNVFIFPELKDYGISKLQKELNEKSILTARAQIRKAISSGISQMPGKMAAEIQKEFNQKIEFLVRLKNNFNFEFRERIQRWAERHLPEASITTGLPFALSASKNGETVRFKIKELETCPNPCHEPENLIRNLTLHNRELSTSLKASLISQLNQTSYNYLNKISAPTKTKDYLRSVLVSSQIAAHLKDWTPSSFDSHLGQYRFQELFPEIVAKDFDQPLFPKDAYFAISLSNLSDSLEFLTHPSTSLFLISIEGKTLSGHEYLKLHNPPITPLAAYKENFNPSLFDLAYTKDTIDSLGALSAFVELLDGVEKTNNPFLLKPLEDGETPLNKIKAALPKVLNLIMVQANYLSNTARLETGLLTESINHQNQKSKNPVSLGQHLAAVNALLTAAEKTKMTIYQWEALKLFRAMSSQFYDMKLQVWKNPQDKAPMLLDILELNSLLPKLERQLSPSEMEQAQWILDPWIKAVHDLSYEVSR